MKKLFFLTLVLLLSISMVGCSIYDKSFDEQSEDVETIFDIESGKSNGDEIEENVTNGTQLQFLSALETYVESDKVSDTLLKAYKEADTVKSVPVLGTYLETTDVVAYMFFKDNSICSTALLSFDIKGEPVSIELAEFAETDISKYPFIDTHSNEACYIAIKECLSTDPDFEILGVVHSNSGYQTTLPIGRSKGETVIKYFFNQPMSFNLVEPFESIEEGRIAFAKYLVEQDAIKSEIPIFSWKTEKFYENGFWRKYSLDYIYDDTAENKDKILPFVEAEIVVSWISIPLLDEELNEGVLISHLLYYRNQLIGEVVIKENQDYSVSAIYARIAHKDADGAYVPIEKSEYQKAIESAASDYSHIEIEGVIFDEGRYIPFGYQGDEIIYMVE